MNPLSDRKKILLPIGVLFLFSAFLFSQSSVDKLVQSLDAMTTFAYDGWKYNAWLSKDDSIAASLNQPGFDDSSWDTMKFRERHSLDYCWLRKEIVLPERVFGQPVSGPVKLLMTVDDYGYLWINGESKGQFNWNGEFELTKDARPGEKFLIVIKAVNNGGPLRILQAEVEMEKHRPLVQQIKDLALSFRVGQKILSFDTYQTTPRLREDPGLDKSKFSKAEKNRLNRWLQELASQIDLAALESGSLDKFNGSVSRIRAKLKPIAQFVKKFTLFFDANAHIDAAWLWREKETIAVARNTFASVLNMMNLRPSFTYTQSSAVYYDWMERLYPDIFKEIQQRVKEGRWELIGGMWIEPDCNLPSGESWMRHLLYAKRYFLQKFGINITIGWNPDSFGYNWNMPQFYRQAGIDAFITQKIGWNDTNIFPYRTFWWEGPDGSRILSYFPFDYVNTIDDPFLLADWLRQFEANTGYTKMMILFGVGDHGGGPSMEMLDRIERLKSLDIYPSIEYGTTAQYLDWIKKQDLSELPTWKDELYLEYHRGTYTTQAKNKAFNRTGEVLMTNAEKFSTLAMLLGAEPRNVQLEEAWRIVLFNQFHDILPGSSIREVYIDSAEEYQEALAMGHHELKRSLGHIARNINTSTITGGTPISVVNPLSWERTDVVKLKLPAGDSSEYAVFDLEGKEIPSQVVPVKRNVREILFTAEGIPPLGYKTYVLKMQTPAAKNPSLRISPAELENEFFKVAVDPDSGWIKSIIDKRNGKEILSGPGNELQILEDRPAQWDAWNIGLTGKKFPSAFRTIEIVETGPVRVVLRAYRDYLKPGTKKDFPTEDFPSTFFTQDIILYGGADRIDFQTDVDWWEEHTMLKVAFPVTLNTTFATYEIPFGFIQRSTRTNTPVEKAQFETAALRWADLSEDGYGVSLLNNSKYGYDIKGNTMRLSLLRSPTWPDPTADKGKHSIEYALYPHLGTWREASTVQRGYAFNTPFLSILNNPHEGRLPAAYSFLKLEPSNLVLTTVKKAEDSDAWILQWYESSGEDSQAVLTLPRIPKKVVLSNFLEEEGTSLPFNKNTVTVTTQKNSAKTIKVYF
ncbi:MAG: glycoside hydrolase family 38 C-terminal domain-containing protein [Candidatus Aminicenantales bacterium]